MSNTFGRFLTVTLFGESHGEVVGATLDGLAAGIIIDEDYISHALALRRPTGEISTARNETDAFRVVSGVYDGFTTGAPLTIVMPNVDVRDKDYGKMQDIPRPSHADYTAHVKYRGYSDFRGGGRFSGRLTAPIVAVGAIVRRVLEGKGIFIGTHVVSLGGLKDRPISDIKDIEKLNDTPFPVLDEEAAERMLTKIQAVKADGDSVGGVLETVVLGVPTGLGEPFFDSVESVISHGLFSIPGVKGVEFGAGFALGDMLGSQANDPFTVENGRIVTTKNDGGGVQGGISNGMPILFRTAVKPTSSIAKPQSSVSLSKRTERTLTVHGRHDATIVHRARAVVDAVTALALGDLFVSQYVVDGLRR